MKITCQEKELPSPVYCKTQGWYRALIDKGDHIAQALLNSFEIRLHPIWQDIKLSKDELITKEEFEIEFNKIKEACGL